MENPLTRQLGVFGPRNSGKTTFWACLYASKGSSEGAASFPEEQTRQQLDALWRLLSTGTVAPATAQGEPTDIAFQFHSHAVSWRVSTMDYSGSLVELSRLQQQPTDQASRDLRRRISAWIRECDAMLVLVPADLASQDADARLVFRRAMESLLAVFNGTQNAGPLPICIAVTKSDILPVLSHVDSPALTGEPQGDLPAWLDELVRLVRHQVGDDNAKVFLTSAFGGHDHTDSARPPTAGPTPQGLEQPLTWVLRQSDRCLVNTAVVTAKSSLDLWPHRYAKAIRYCERITGKGLPPEGATQVGQLLEKLMAARRRQWQLRAAAICLTCFAAIAAMLGLHAQRLQNVAMAAIATGSVTPSYLKNVRAFIESSNPAIPLLFRSDLRIATQWHSERIKHQAERILGLLAHNNDTPESHWQLRVDNARARIEACDSFCQLFPAASERFVFEEETKRARSLIGELERYGPFDKAYADLVDELRNATTSESSRNKVGTFKSAFPPLDFPLRSDAYQRLASIIDSQAKDEQYSRFISWETRIRANYARDPSLRSSHLEEIQKWLDAYVGEADRRGDLEQVAGGLADLRHKIALDWDVEEYGKLKIAAGLMFESPEKLKAAIEYGNDYLQSAREVRAMQSHVRAWLTYARALQSTQRVGITANNINVVDSKFAQGSGGVRVSVQTRGDDNASWGELLESKWITATSKDRNLGDIHDNVTIAISRGQIKIYVEEYNYIGFSNDTGSEVRNLLSLAETFQKPGQDEAECRIVVAGAIVTVTLTDLPKRPSLPDYEKSR